MKKTLAIILLLCTAITSFVSCGGNTDTPASATTAADNNTTVEETTEPVVTDILGYLPDADYEGYEFRMLTRNFERWVKDMYIESEVGDIVDDAVYKRNMRVSEEFNVIFKHTPSSNDNYETDAVKVILAGDDAYDLVVPHARAAFIYANQKLFLDWNKDFEYIDLDNP